MKKIPVTLVLIFLISKISFAQEINVTATANISSLKITNIARMTDNNTATFADFSDGAYAIFAFSSSIYVTRLELHIGELLSGQIRYRINGSWYAHSTFNEDDDVVNLNLLCDAVQLYNLDEDDRGMLTEVRIFATQTPNLPDLITTDLGAGIGNSKEADPGQVIPVGCEVDNVGTGPVYPNQQSTLKYYISPKNYIDQDATLLGQETFYGTGERDKTVTIPAQLTPGNYYILYEADAKDGSPYGSIYESNESNNVSYLPFVVNQVFPDFIITGLSTPTSAVQGQTISVSFNVKNQGAASGNSGSAKIYLSANTSLTGATELGTVFTGTLGAGASTSKTINVTVPSSYGTGNKYIVVKADANNQTSESNEGNNLSSKQISINGYPDLTVSGAGFSPSLIRRNTDLFSWSAYVNNNGNDILNTATFIGVFLSKNTSFSSDDILIDEKNIGNLNPGQQRFFTGSNFIYDWQASNGSYYVLFVADWSNGATESNETNNVVNVTSVTLTSPSGRISDSDNSDSNNRDNKNKALLIREDLNVFSVIDIQGKTIWNGNSDKDQFDFSSLKEGLYIVRSLKNDRVDVQKIYIGK